MRIFQSEAEQSAGQTKPVLWSVGDGGRGLIALFVREAFERAGVEINGSRPWDIRVLDPRFYARVLTGGSLGLGESYVDGNWDSDQVDQMLTELLRHGIQDLVPMVPAALFRTAQRLITNPQRVGRAQVDVRAHYDRDNALYQAMLDGRMTYSCAYWRDATDLDEAQEAKLDLVCRKLGLKAGQTVLDIGCGWGSFARYAAEKYGVHVFGITLSNRQAELGRTLCRGLPVELHVLDYRALRGQFDHVVSLGMLEHVGVRNYRTFFEVVRRCLKPEGLFLLQTIGSLKSTIGFDPWLEKYIFPGAQLPSLEQLSRAMERLFVIEDLHNFGADYDRTLMAWRANFDRHWPNLRERYDERFRRMWRYYLSLCAATFRARLNQVFQLVLSPDGVTGGYRSIR